MATEKAEIPEAAEPVLLRSDLDGITTLTLNRPKSGNSLSHELVDALQAAWDEIDNDASVRVVVLAASGRLFCTGHDLNESIDAMEDPPTKLAANRA
ncbi:MAG: enoyl-CoA hydratase-related protein, partial [Alphaproteobacteria bacterium]